MILEKRGNLFIRVFCLINQKRNETCLVEPNCHGVFDRVKIAFCPFRKNVSIRKFSSDCVFLFKILTSSKVKFHNVRDDRVQPPRHLAPLIIIIIISSTYLHFCRPRTLRTPRSNTTRSGTCRTPRPSPSWCRTRGCSRGCRSRPPPGTSRCTASPGCRRSPAARLACSTSATPRSTRGPPSRGALSSRRPV